MPDGAGTPALARLTGRILRAGGLNAVVAGGPDEPVVEAVLHPQPPDVVVVDLGDRSSDRSWRAGGSGGSGRVRRQAEPSFAPLASVWFDATSGASAAPLHGSSPAPSGPVWVYAGTRLACVYEAAAPASEAAVREADVREGCRAIGITLGVPAPSFLGVVDEVLCDRRLCPTAAPVRPNRAPWTTRVRPSVGRPTRVT